MFLMGINHVLQKGNRTEEENRNYEERKYGRGRKKKPHRERLIETEQPVQPVGRRTANQVQMCVYVPAVPGQFGGVFALVLRVGIQGSSSGSGCGRGQPWKGSNSPGSLDMYRDTYLAA